MNEKSDLGMKNYINNNFKSYLRLKPIHQFRFLQLLQRFHLLITQIQAISAYSLFVTLLCFPL